MAMRATLNVPQPVPGDLAAEKLATSTLRASLLFTGERRMEASGYLAPGYATRLAIEAKAGGWTSLATLARTWQPPRLKGIQVSPEFGTPFLAATQVYDMRPVPRKWLAPSHTPHYHDRFVSHGTILVTCSGTVGRATLAHSSTSGMLVSHDLLRVVPNDADWLGWIYAYLRAPSVRQMARTAQYGHIIKHLETQHLDRLPVLRLKRELRDPFDQSLRDIVSLRDQANVLATDAERTFQTAMAPVPPDIDNGSAGFSTRAYQLFGRGRRLEGSYYNPFARTVESITRKHASGVDALGKLVERVFVPGRFTHIYGDEGVPQLDSGQIVELAPDVTKRVLSLKPEEMEDYFVDESTLLMPCSGQLHGVIGRVVLANRWHEEKVLNNHIVRIVPGPNPNVRMGYLQAALGHPLLGRPRVLRAAFGSSVPELSPDDVARVSVPRLSATIEHSIADALEEATDQQARADQLEERVAASAEQHLQRFLSGDRTIVDAAVG